MATTPLRVIWQNPAEARATLVGVRRGRAVERVLGPRALLTIDEAAAVLERPREAVERSIRAGFLRVVRRQGRRYVTMRACAAFRREEEADLAAARAAETGPLVPADEVYRRAGL